MLFALVVFLWGLNWSVMKRGLSFVPPATLVMVQYSVSMIALSPVFIILRKRVPTDTGTLVKLVAYSLLYLFQVALMRFGLVGESSGMAAVILYAQPLFVLPLAIPFLKERITIEKIMGATVGFVGVLILFLDRMNSLMLNYAAIMVFSAFLWAVETVYYKKLLSHVDPLVSICFQFLTGTLILVPLCIVTDNFTLPGNWTFILTVLYSSVGSFVVGWSIWLYLLGKEEATVLSSSSLVVPVIALFIGWLTMGEGVGIQSVFGSTLTLGGVYLVNLMNRHRSNRDRHKDSVSRK